MDDIKIPKRRHTFPQSHQRSVAGRHHQPVGLHSFSNGEERHHAKSNTSTGNNASHRSSSVSLRFSFRKPNWLKFIMPNINEERRSLLRDFRVRSGIVLVTALIMLAEVLSMLQPYIVQPAYALGEAGTLLSPINQQMADKLKFDAKNRVFNFNNDSYNATQSGITGAAGQQITATANEDPRKGISVTDTVNQVDFTMTPKFDLSLGKQDGNRVVYPLANNNGWLVYTMHGIGVKEDLLLNQSTSDNMTLDYNLGIGNDLVAKLQRDGSVGVYGDTLLSGNVSTGTDKDAALLQKARQNAPKNTLMFSIPAPKIEQINKKSGSVKAEYSLSGSTLKVNITGLNKATYPLTIDPSIYVTTAEAFMKGNNETNIDFDVADTLIQKGKTTGARFDAWNPTSNLPTGMWGSGTAVAGGYIYSVGGTTFTGQIYNTQGADTYVVPTGVTSITVKLWGGGGGGGGGGTNSGGGAGGGGGYVNATMTVTPGETLNVYVGGGGKGGGTISSAGGGAGGGGYSSLYRSTTPLVIAAGGAGGGGGGTNAGYTGAVGGAGGGTTGVNGSNGTSAQGGKAGTPSAGGAGGTAGNNVGGAGSSLTGGLGANGRTANGSKGGGAAGGLASGGNGGIVITSSRAAGGGGGAGYYGGGGGAGSTNRTNGGGGGGGSSYTNPSDTSVTNTAGSGVNPGNPSDPYLNGAALGGAGAPNNSSGTAGQDGMVVITYGAGTSVSSAMSWAKFNTTTGTIDSSDPGSGLCSGWCTTAAYNLPTGLANFSLVAYSGFLYAIGGVNSAGVRQNTVYIAKLGANGEPRLWHPTDTNQNNWVYWYQDTGLTSIRAYTAAVAYNNRMYLLGGLGVSSTTPVNTVEIANINPTGTLGSWTASTTLPVALYGHSAQVYNDRLYAIGGASSVGGAPLNTAYYIKINSDGTLNSWIQTTSFAASAGGTGKMSLGGNITTVWGGYIYISGGCSAVNASGYCTNIDSDTQLASINADGSLDSWNTDAAVVDSRMGQSIVAWRSYIYEIGGCSAQSSVTGLCTAMLNTINFGTINQDGDASTVSQSVPSGTAPCSGANPYNCNLPPAGTGAGQGGQMLSATAIMNGYLYVIGGCSNYQCNATSGNTSYSSIASNGTLTAPSNCVAVGNTLYGAWCVDSTHQISGGIAAAGTAVFGGRIYLVGGLTGGGNTSNFNYISVNSDGSLNTGGWVSQTFTSAGITGGYAVSYLYSYSRANPASAGTNPGNLYMFGGCTATSSAGCTSYSQAVYKCSITTTGSIDVTGGGHSPCTTTGQLQIGIIPGDTVPGLGIMAGTVYANYIYLIGGVSPNLVDLKTTRYAQFDNNNNVVAVSGGGGGWIESPNQTAVGRRRAAAFGYNGYIYVVGGYEAGQGILADIEFAKVSVSDGSIGPFSVSAVTINQRWGLSVPISNSFAYVIGGCNNGNSPTCNSGGLQPIVQTFQVYNNDSGSPAGYATSANTYGTSPNRIGASSTILNGYIYVAGGCTSATDCTTAINTVSYAAIDANGNLGAWSNTTATLPAVRTWGKLLAAGGTLYYMGGQSSTATDERAEVFYGTPSSGNVSTWSTASNILPQARTQFGAAVWNNRLYVVGGLNSSAAATNTVYVSPQLNSGGDITAAWATTSTSFNVARSGLTVVAYANNIYVFGGFDGTNYLSDSQYAQISTTDGSIGSWTYTTSLPGPLTQADGFAVNGYMYLIGGRSSATTCTPLTLVSPISANTTIATGNNPTGIGEWYQTNRAYTGSRYGAAAVYNDGKAYVLGGGCGATLTYASPVTQQTTLLTQPQVAKYSIMFDTDTDVYPLKWLLNGVDNSIGANWQLSYRSMKNTTSSCLGSAMTTWGQTTNFGNVTLGLPGPYIPLDGSGTNTKCARFFYLAVTIDSSRAFGYPEDVSRGPTITDLTLEFTADPAKRLMHGRTFVGGLQQPDSTPF